MDFDMLSVYALSEWVDEIDKEIEGIDTDIRKYSSARDVAEATIRSCDANLNSLKKRKEQLRMRSQCLSSLEDEKYAAMEAIDYADMDDDCQDESDIDISIDEGV